MVQLKARKILEKQKNVQLHTSFTKRGRDGQWIQTTTEIQILNLGRYDLKGKL